MIGSPCYRVGLYSTRYSYQRGSDHPLPQLVSLAQHRDDLPGAVLTAVFVGHRFVHVGVEGLALGLDGRDALGLEDALQLAMDQGDALGPPGAGLFGRPILQRPVKVVEYVETAVNDAGRGGLIGA